MGNIKWSAVSVSEAMDKAEAEIEPIFECLHRAYSIVKEAYLIPNLPDYMSQRLMSLGSEIKNITGEDLQRHGSRISGSLRSVRNTIPDGAIEKERAAAKDGKTTSLFAQ